MISVVVVTCNRLHLLEQCVERVVKRLSDETDQIVIWNNASTDGTREYLDGLRIPRLEVVHHPENIGTNAFARAFRMCRGSYLIELDDDVIDAPEHWDRSLRDAFDRVPKMGFLAAACIDDGKSVAAEILYRRDAHLYKQQTVNGVSLLAGPTGGWCTMTSREVYDAAGGFTENPKFTFWHEDGEYVRRVMDAGYRCALLADVKVFHASGEAYSKDTAVSQEKARYYRWREWRRYRRHRVKLLLDAIPPIRALNRRFGWYRIVPEHGQRPNVEKHL